MKIVLIGRDGYESLEWHFRDTFNRLSHQATIVDFKNVTHLPEKAQYWLSRFSERYDRAISRSLVNYICQLSPDFVLVVYRHIHPSVIVELKKRLPHCPIAQYNPDALTNLERQQILASPFDFYFTKEPYLAEVFRQKAGLNVFYLPEAFNPHVNVRPADNRALLEAETNIDVMLYGNLYPYRARMVERLIQAGIRPTIFGLPANYMPPSVKRAFVGRYLTGDEKNRVISGAKIVFNNLHYAEVSSANKKYFEINGIGGFQLCDYKPTLAEYSGVHVEKITFNSIDEAIDQIRYYLDKPTERYTLSDQQYGHFQVHHTYEKRVQQLLSIVFGHA
ncbi:glycosyltransferase [Fibrella sp. WM1]|uniref:CgeB family protein n=1 Tax=Fibrella musci TaxID=3242485 RepID=UPI0035229149